MRGYLLKVVISHCGCSHRYRNSNGHSYSSWCEWDLIVLVLPQQDPEDEDLKAQIDKELEEEERWPSPFDTATESDGDSAVETVAPPMSPSPPASVETLPLPHTEGEELEDEEDKRYILEKIQQANQELKAQAAPDDSRRRRLQFKDSLVDLVVPPVEYEQDGAPHRSSKEQPEEEQEV